MTRIPFTLLASLLLLGTLAAAPREPRKVDHAPATATLVPLSENWRLDGDVPVHALLISLQGLANREQPRLYLEYPKSWQWEIVHPLRDFLATRHGVKWERLATDDADAALARFAGCAKGVVVWDKAVRSSLIVAFTIAGVEDLVVVNEDLLPLAQKHGLAVRADLRGQFRGQSDAQIYRWAYDHYFERCSRDYYVVLGGHAGPEMQPGIADFGIQQRAFFSDLSANPKHPEELALLKTILSRQNPASVVLGWHSYGKDTEGQHTTLVGNYGLIMEGLHNLPNVSFTSQIPLTPDFKFANNHHVRPDEKLRAEKKVYICAVATDAMGIGTWTKPGRGQIPYTWQVLMNWVWMNPPVLQYFYENKSPNDYFIGGLSGPGYMYPKAIPAEKFPGLMSFGRDLMQRLDLRVLEIMDYSEGNRHVGNTDLPRELVDRYYRAYPDVLGFINGYGSARTFDLRDGKPFLSYDYYLDVNRTIDEAAADLEELIQLNPGRPYFLLMHVRESNTIEKVATIFARLSEPVEVVPLDVFLKLAASQPTFPPRLPATHGSRRPESVNRTPLQSAVEMRDGRPTLVLNGEPHAPLLYALSDCPGARWTWEEVPARNIRLFAEHGVRLFQCDIWLHQMLDAAGRLDIALARRQAAGITAQCADAAVMFRLHVNPPKAWCEAHPDECVGYADIAAQPDRLWGLQRPLGTDGGNPLRASFASTLWLEWARAQLETFCRELSRTPEGASVFAIQLANGLYGEWHQFGFLHHDPDTGVAATRSYRAWLRAKYGNDAGLARAWHRPGATIDTVLPPGTPERESASLGVLRDPQTQQDLIDYFRWLHETMADALLTLAGDVKRHWPRPIVTAAFQGYFYGQFARNAAGSHLAHDKVLASPHLDCLCSPASYTAGVRAFGGSGHGRGIMGAVRRAGKLWLDENDHGTSLVGCPWDREFHGTLDDDIACIRRNALQPVLRGGGQWWYDFGMIAGTPAFASHGNVGWWDHPRLIEEIRAVHALAQSRHTRPYRRPADTLVIHDPWSFCHTVARRWSLEGFKFGDQPPPGPNPFSGKGMDGLLEGLFRSGLVFEDALIGELGTVDLSPYRLVFFGSTPVFDATARDHIAQRLARDGRHLVLTGFTGWGDGARVDPALATQLSGIPTALTSLANPLSRLALDGATEEQQLEPPKDAPCFTATDAHVVGRWSDGTLSAARRDGTAATWWNFAVCPVTPSMLRALGRRAGCHIVNDHNDATSVGDGLLMIHTVDGGPRRLRLPGGSEIAITLAPRSTTVLDADTGAVLLA